MPFDPSAMFARTPTDVWAIGARGAVMHFDGSAWTAVPANTAEDLHDIWMASETDGWLVGAGGVIRRWNGSVWTTIASDTTAALRGVWGTSAKDVWIVGDGVARRWTGASLSTPPALSTPSLSDVFATPAKVFAIGEERVWEYTGATWSAVTPGSSTFTFYSLRGIAGTATTAFVVGRVIDTFFSNEELIYRWDGQAWTWHYHPGDPELAAAFTSGGRVYGVTDESILDLETFDRTVGPPSMVSASAADGQLFAASLGGRLYRREGLDWSLYGYGARERITAAGQVGERVWFGTSSGTVLEWRGGLVRHDAAASREIRALAGTGRDDVWIADDFDKVFHFDGRGWSRAQVSLPDIQAIHASADEVVVLGRGIRRKAAMGWTDELVPGATGVTWEAVDELAGDLYAVGSDGATPPVAHAARRTNGTWSELPQPGVARLCGVAVIAANDVWAVGNDGKTPSTGLVSHWDGAAWTTTPLVGTGAPCAIEVVAGEVVVAGADGELHRRATDGKWTVEPLLATGRINALRATSTELWAAGDQGAILRR